jgi:hypothetical protein
MRGTAVLAGPLTPRGVPRSRTPRERFDTLVLEAVGALEQRWSDELDAVEFAVEETPVLPDDWTAPTVPLASLVDSPRTDGRRLVLFRRPIELRAEGHAELGALVFAVLVEQVAELLGRSPEEIDPRYEAG